jgi:hypothetical protein
MCVHLLAVFFVVVFQLGQKWLQHSFSSPLPPRPFSVCYLKIDVADTHISQLPHITNHLSFGVAWLHCHYANLFMVDSILCCCHSSLPSFVPLLYLIILSSAIKVTHMQTVMLFPLQMVKYVNLYITVFWNCLRKWSDLKVGKCFANAAMWFWGIVPGIEMMVILTF